VATIVALTRCVTSPLATLIDRSIKYLCLAHTLKYALGMKASDKMATEDTIMVSLISLTMFAFIMAVCGVVLS
jgi:hypothetical protein